MTAEAAARLGRMVGYPEQEILDMLQTKYHQTPEGACGILLQVDTHLQQQEADHGAH